MKISYKDINLSVKLSLDGIKVHKKFGPSFIRNKNLKEDQTLIYNEEINEDLIEYEAENEEEAIYLLEGSSVTSGETVVSISGNDYVVVRAPLYVKRTNSNNSSQPGYMSLGKGIEGIVFGDYKNQGMSAHFDLGPKYKRGTKVFMAVGWSPMSSSTGKVVFEAYWTAGNPNVREDVYVYENPVEKRLLSAGSGWTGSYVRAVTSEENAFLPEVDANGIISMEFSRLGKDYYDSFYGSIAVTSLTLFFKIPEAGE